jgi:hypothetical protein
VVCSKILSQHDLEQTKENHETQQSGESVSGMGLKHLIYFPYNIKLSDTVPISVYFIVLFYYLIVIANVWLYYLL